MKRKISIWLATYSLVYLRITLGIIFLWFGLLKFFPNVSDIDDLVMKTLQQMTFGVFSRTTSLIFVGILECIIGAGLILGKFKEITLILLAIQLTGTMMPLFLFPKEVFYQVPFAPTLEGQYIIKNFLTIGVAMVLGATMRGGAVVATPEAEKTAKKHHQEVIR